MNSKILQIFCAILSAHSLAPFLVVKEKSGFNLTGCYQRNTATETPVHEKIGEPKYFLTHLDCWIFSTDAGGLDVRFILR